MNAGKRFEADFKASVPKDVWCYRLRDNPATFYDGMEDGPLRFASDNICDFILFKKPNEFLVELKTVSTQSAALSSMFGKFDAEKGRYKKQKHLEDMVAAATHDGIQALVFINFRISENTFAIPAADVLEFVQEAAAGGRKSIPPVWAELHGTLINQRKLRVNWRYDLAEIFGAVR